jgi:hypothetical protein
MVAIAYGETYSLFDFRSKLREPTGQIRDQLIRDAINEIILGRITG